MQVPLEITFRDIPRSDAIEARIREKAAKLEAFYPRLTGCRVVLGQRDRHRHQGRQFTVRIGVRMPQHEFMVNRDHAEDIYVALRDAFDAARRRLEDFARMERGEVKRHEQPLRGRVVRLFAQEGYGFIETPEGDEYYFSRENLAERAFDDLAPGTAVQFIGELAGEGRQARRVSFGMHGEVPAARAREAAK